MNNIYIKPYSIYTVHIIIANSINNFDNIILFFNPYKYKHINETIPINIEKLQMNINTKFIVNHIITYENDCLTQILKYIHSNILFYCIHLNYNYYYKKTYLNFCITRYQINITEPFVFTKMI